MLELLFMPRAWAVGRDCLGLDLRLGEVDPGPEVWPYLVPLRVDATLWVARRPLTA